MIRIPHGRDEEGREKSFSGSWWFARYAGFAILGRKLRGGGGGGGGGPFGGVVEDDRVAIKLLDTCARAKFECKQEKT